MEILMKAFITALILASLVMTGTAFAAAPKDKPDKKGILVVSFGTSMPEARKAIDNLVNATKKAFPDTEVRLAYTSNIIRRKIAKEQNLNIPTPTSALAQMNDEGFTHVYVMPMHIIPGEEYDDITGLVNGLRAVKGKYEFRELKVGKPYLASVKDCDVMADILMKRFAKDLAQKGTGIVLMGHGTPHRVGDLLLVAAQKALAVAHRLVLAGKPAVDDMQCHLLPLERLSVERFARSPPDAKRTTPSAQLLLRTRRYHSHSRRTCLGV